MSHHFTVEFEEVSPENFYSEEVSRDEIDERFKQRVLEEIDEDGTVEACYSENVNPPYVAIRINFERRNAQLYERFGSSGLTDIVESVAEDVYGHKASKSMMEGWG